jgi:nucleotide-binding universal stress UspA family protein
MVRRAYSFRGFCQTKIVQKFAFTTHGSMGLYKKWIERLAQDAMKNIIVAVDFSNATPEVLKIAASLAKSFGADLQLLHVIEPEPAYTAYGFTPDEFPLMNSFHEEAKRRASLKLEELLAEIRTDIPSASCHLAEGNPLRELLEYVKQSQADFVVIGSHGHGVIASLLLGSLAEGMVRKATVPTLVVPVRPE